MGLLQRKRWSVDTLPPTGCPTYSRSSQYDIVVVLHGLIRPDGYDAVIIRGDVRGKAFHVFWLVNDGVVAGMHINLRDEWWARCRSSSAAGSPLTTRLADHSVSLEDLADGQR